MCHAWFEFLGCCCCSRFSLAGERESNGNSQLQGFPCFYIKNNVPKRKDGKKQKQNKTNKTAQTKKKKQGRPDLIYDMSDDRWMRGRCIGKGGNLHLQ